MYVSIIGIQIYGNAVDVWLYLTVVGYVNVKDGRTEDASNGSQVIDLMSEAIMSWSVGRTGQKKK